MPASKCCDKRFWLNANVDVVVDVVVDVHVVVVVVHVVYLFRSWSTFFEEKIET